MMEILNNGSVKLITDLIHANYNVEISKRKNICMCFPISLLNEIQHDKYVCIIYRDSLLVPKF